MCDDEAAPPVNTVPTVIFLQTVCSLCSFADPSVVNADLLNHPDYKYLVRHNGEPNLSLLGGPDADITPANLLKKLMVKWSEEAEESAEQTTPGFGACAGSAVMPERWAEAGAAAGSGRAMEQGVQGGGRGSSMKSGVKAAGTRGAGDRRRRRKNKSLKPNAEAVSMANQGVHFSFASCCTSGQLHHVRRTVHGCSTVCNSCCCELPMSAGCSVVGVIDQATLCYTPSICFGDQELASDFA